MPGALCLVHTQVQKQLATLEQHMNARLGQLELVVRENNARCLLGRPDGEVATAEEV